MSRNKNLSHFKNLVAVAYADDEITDEELNFLAQKALKFGLDKQEVQDILEIAEFLPFNIPDSPEEREQQLVTCIHMAMTDGEVHDKEYQLCLQIAEKLDFTERYLNEIIELTKKLKK